MRRSGSGASALASPVLVGAVTVLVVTVAVFLAYNANNGLPFVPTTTLKLEVANGANVVPGNEVRSGGFRIGVVRSLQPVMLAGGRVGARLELQLDKSVGDIPRDTVVKVRPRSALGLKYLELTEGTSKRVYRDGDTIPASQARVPVEIDEVFSTFDKPTREASQVDLDEFGNAFAGRGVALGDTIEVLPALTRVLEPVMRNLSSRETDLPRFFRELQETVSVLAPVSGTQARLFTTMADTFAAISRDPAALRATIEKGPPTLDVGTDSLRAQRPFLSDFAAFSEDFRGATSALRDSLPTINRAVSRGIGVQRRAVELNTRLGDTLRATRELATAPGTNTGLRGLTDTVSTLNPAVRYLGPFITVCNSWNYFWTFTAEHFTEGDAVGSSQRALLNSTGRQKNSLSSMGASDPANGEEVNEGDTPQHLVGQAYGAAIDDQGKADCEYGQRGFPVRAARYAPPKFDIVRDPQTPGNQGPTPRGRPQVPPGQTFTRRPQTGPYADFPAGEYGDK